MSKQEQAIQKVQSALEARSKTQSLFEAGELFGGIVAVSRIAKSLTSQVVRALERAQEAKIHEAYGYKRFDDFLDQHEGSPMKSDTFYRQRDLLYKEGDLVFDALQNAGIPASTRKLLGKGVMELDGDELVIGEHRVPLSDVARLKPIIKDITFQQEKHAKKMADLEKDLREAKTKLVETVKAASKGKPDKEVGTPFGQALLMVIVAMNELTAQVGELDQDELKAKQDNTLRRIGEQTKALMEAFTQSAAPLKPKGKKNLADLASDDAFDD